MSGYEYIKQEYFPSKVKMVEVSFHACRDKDLGSNDNLTIKIFSALQCNHSA